MSDEDGDHWSAVSNPNPPLSFRGCRGSDYSVEDFYAATKRNLQTILLTAFTGIILQNYAEIPRIGRASNLQVLYTTAADRGMTKK